MSASFKCLGSWALVIPLVVFREQSELTCNGRATIAGGDEFFEAELVEVGSEILKEFALEGVITIAVNNLAPKCIRVKFQVGLDLSLNITVLGVELVVLSRPGGSGSLIQ